MNSFDDYKIYNSFVDRVKGLIKNEYYAKAAEILREGLTEKPNDRGFQRFYLIVLLKLDKLKEAKFWLREIILRYENNYESKKSSLVGALYYKGLYYFLEGDFKRSMECLENCFELDINYFKKLLHDKTFGALRNSAEFKKLITTSKEFTVNEYISLKLLFSKTLIYVCEELFLTCQKVAINIAPTEFEEYADFNTIDDILDFYRSHTANEEGISMTPEEEFWGHCSNLQAWVENDYNTCVLSKYISFPLLKELHDKGISRFTLIFKEELIDRIKAGGINTLRYFLENEDNYIQYLTEDDLFDNLLPSKEADIMRTISKFIPLEYTLTTNLKDSREYTYFRDYKKMHFCIENGHIIELEILLDKTFNNELYHKALLQVRNLRYLKEIEIYYSYKIHISGEKEFVKTFSISRDRNSLL